MSPADREAAVAGLRLRVIWKDEDMMEVRATAGNGRFFGSVDFYTAHDELTRLPETLRGFPSAIPDLRSIRLGEWQDQHRVGGLELALECGKMTGVAVARIKLRCHQEGEVAGAESVALVTKVEPAAVDRFVAMLAACGPRVGAEARLFL